MLQLGESRPSTVRLFQLNSKTRGKMGSLKPGSRANRSDQTILAAESDVKRVASAILPLMVIDRNSTAPLYKQIYDGYRSAIVRRMLRPGQRVPSTRMHNF